MESKDGSICWFELATTDPAAARHFYSGLLGWSANEVPMGPEFSYTIFQLNGKDAAGAYRLMKEQVEQGVPSHWMLYIKTTSSDEAFTKAINLGAAQIAAPFDVPNVGRMSVLRDPTGAIISTFQPGGHRGLEVFGQTGAICWVELQSPDPDKAAQFYADWLGWKYESGKDGYRHIIAGEGKSDMIGGIPAEMEAPQGTPAHWLAYIRVADCTASSEKADQLGAKTILPAAAIPEVGTISILADPQGAVFALYEEPKRA
jgi:predicted enzyme related to lactoylglutathione lyase